MPICRRTECRSRCCAKCWGGRCAKSRRGRGAPESRRGGGSEHPARRRAERGRGCSACMPGHAVHIAAAASLGKAHLSMCLQATSTRGDPPPKLKPPPLEPKPAMIADSELRAATASADQCVGCKLAVDPQQPAPPSRALYPGMYLKSRLSGKRECAPISFPSLLLSCSWKQAKYHAVPFSPCM